jgi:UDP-glucuronate 4-epimerase
MPKLNNYDLTIFITGCAGFIGFHLAKRLLGEGYIVTGADAINDYYDTRLKTGRLQELGITGAETTSTVYPRFTFYKADICDKERMGQIFETGNFDVVINLAAQAGVRYSLENPQAYIDSNIQGFLNMLELCRRHKPGHFIFASSSSVYGLNKKMPFSVRDHTDHPISLYAATKKSNEVMAHTYSHLFGIPTSGLRFFTVYGPWGRPDMAYFSFTKKIINGEPIDVFNEGNLMRDFTYINDIVEGIARLINKPPQANADFNTLEPDPSQSFAPYRLYNIGNNTPVKLIDFIETLEEAIGKKAVKNYLPMQPGDVYATYADISHLAAVTGFEPKTGIKEGLADFVQWYKTFYDV